MTVQGTIFNIQRYTVSDGPGIRTELFLKGCPLSCRWCGNPEGNSESMELGIYSSKCIGLKACGLCIDACPEKDVIKFDEAGKIESVDRERCTGCMKCVEACPSDAIKAWGQVYSVSEVMDIIRRDKEFYDKSGGGVTLSGGEPLMQSKFASEVMKQCQLEGIHTCLESTFCTAWETIEEAVRYADLLISDVKTMNEDTYRKYIGDGYRRSLDNLSKLAASGHEMIIRIPLIPGVNDNQDNIVATADYIEDNIGNNLRTIQLLSYMRLGVEKYESLGVPYPMGDMEFDREEFQKRVQEISDYFNNRGLRCIIGSRDK